jgi:hypothetical protein
MSNQYDMAIYVVSNDDADEMEMLQDGFNGITPATTAAKYAFEDGDVPEGSHIEAWFISDHSPIGTVAAARWDSKSDF